MEENKTLIVVVAIVAIAAISMLVIGTKKQTAQYLDEAETKDIAGQAHQSNNYRTCTCFSGARVAKIDGKLVDGKLFDVKGRTAYTYMRPYCLLTTGCEACCDEIGMTAVAPGPIP